jgi:phosphoribosylpyrophosphate synthetase
MKRTENLRNEFLTAGVDCSLAFLNEVNVINSLLKNSNPEESKFMYIGENVNKRNCIIMDTMFKNIPSLIDKVDLLKKQGASAVYCYCIHGAFSEEEIKMIEKSKIDEVLTTNTVTSS